MVSRIIACGVDYNIYNKLHKNIKRDQICYIGRFNDHAIFLGDGVIIDWELLKNKIGEVGDNYSILLIINKKYAYVEFPNLDKFPDIGYLIDKNFIYTSGEYGIYTISEYIIKGIIE